MKTSLIRATKTDAGELMTFKEFLVVHFAEKTSNVLIEQRWVFPDPSIKHMEILLLS